MKNIRRLALMVSLCLLTVLSLGIVLFAASACQPTEQSETLDGTYYADVNGEEYTVAFSSGDSYAFTFSVAGDDRTGTYFYSGSAVTLTFSEEGETLSATLSGDVLSFTYKGTAYEMIPMVTYTVTFDLDGGTGTASAQVVNGRLLPKPADPQKDGNVFIGWYADSAFTEKFDFETQKITGNVTLYARFVEGPAAEEFTVSFETGSGYEGDPIADVQTIGHGIYNLPELPALDGKDFLGWWRSDYEDAAKLTAAVKEGEEIGEHTTLFAVWESDAPAVSVTENGVSWLSLGVNIDYTVTIVGPDDTTYVEDEIVTSLSHSFDFASSPAGDYTITVSANRETTTAYYLNKGLDRVTFFKVEGNILLFTPVENAEYYLIGYTCGTVDHDHVASPVRVDTPSYDFSDCDMFEGGFSFVVQACADGYATSVSEPFVFERHLDEVTGIAVDPATDVLSWGAVANAQSYTVEVTVGGKTEVFRNVTDTSLDLQQFYGELTIEITPEAFGYNSSAVSSTYNKVRLATPENIRTSLDSIVWDAVDGAQAYIVTIDGNEHRVTEPSYSPTEADLEELGNEFSVSVVALAADEANNSFAAQNTVSRVLTNIRYENGSVSWSAVMGVSEYGVRVNDGQEFIVSDATSTPVTLTQSGTNTISVRYYMGEEESGWVDITVDANVTVTLNNNSGAASIETPLYYASGDSILLPADSSRIGYTFSGWYTEQTGGQKVESGTVTASANVTYYAHWTAKSYTLTVTVPESEGYFESEEGQRVQSVEVDITYGSSFELPVPLSQDGTKAFFGWFGNVNMQGTLYTDPYGASVNNWNIDGTVALYPGWVEAFTYNLITDPRNPTAGEGSAYSVSKGEGINYLTEVTVPAMYNGLPVAMVEGSCFASCSRLVTINLPDSIYTVYRGDEAEGTGSAFQGCTSLRYINVYDASSQISGQYEKLFSSYEGLLIYDNPYGGSELWYFPTAITGEFTIPDIVTVLPNYIFRSTNVSVINIPATVTSIGIYAFYSIDIKEVNFLPTPEGVAEVPLTIGEEAFYLSGITSITLPARLESFDVNIFSTCDELEEVNIESSENSIYSSVGGIVFTDNGQTLYFCPQGRSGTYTVPSTVTKIGERAFYECSRLQEVVIPGNVREIGIEAFARCSSLSNIRFEGIANDPALTIGDSAFYRCSSLTSVSLPANLKVLGQYAFGDNTRLTTVTVNTSSNVGDISYSTGAFSSTSGVSSVTTLIIGPDVSSFDINGVFGSTNLESVTVDPANKNFTSVDGVLFNGDSTRILYYPNGRTGAYTLPDSVKEIGAGVFSGKTNLTQITIGPNVEYIGEGAFSGSSNRQENKLQTVIFTEGGTAPLVIGKRAFYKCTSLQNITFPSRLTEIGDEAFVQCLAMTELVIPEGVITIGHAAFHYCTNVTKVSLPSSLESLATFSTQYTYAEVITGSSSETLTATGWAAAGVDNIDVFFACWRIAEISIPETNKYYAAVEGALYGKNAEGVVTTLYFSPAANPGVEGVLTIPATVTEIKDRAFYDAFVQDEPLNTIVFADRSVGTPLTIGFELFVDSAIAHIELPDGMTEIPERMFAGTSLTEIRIPNTVTLIGAGAFNGCESLATILFDEGGTSSLTIADGKDAENGVFAGCEALTEIVFPERLIKIGSYAFACSSSDTPLLTAVEFPSTLTEIGLRAFNYQDNLETVTFKTGSEPLTIGEEAFNYATGLTTLTLSDNVSVIGNSAFFNTSIVSIAIPKGVVSIGEEAFARNSDLTALTFASDGVLESIGSSAFINNTSLTSVVLPASLKTLGASAFSGCSSLASITFQTKEVAGSGGVMKSDLESIGNSAFVGTSISEIAFPESTSNITLGQYLFENCSNLTTVRLSTSIVSIELAFTGCSTIETIIIPEGSQNIQLHEDQPLLLNVAQGVITYAFGPISANAEGEYTLPEGFISIGSGAFYGQNGIKKLSIPATITSIGGEAFRLCRGLEEVVFAEGSVLTTVGEYAFAYCYSLSSINLPEGLTTLNGFAFYGATSLRSIELPGSLIRVANNVFAYSGLTSVNVPALQKMSVGDVDYYADSMFSNCVYLTSVTFDSGLTWLSKNMFSNCTSLENIVLPAGLVSVDPSYESTSYNSGTGPFNESGLKSVNLNGVTKLPAKIFRGASALETVTGLESVTEVGMSAFYGTSLKEANLSAVNALPDGVFYSCASLEKVILNDVMSSIGEHVFQKCTSLKTIDVYSLVPQGSTNNPVGVATLPSALASVGELSFSETAIREITIPEGVTELVNGVEDYNDASDLFLNCTQLEKVVFGGEVSKIGAGTFEGCTNLKTIQYSAGGEVFGETGEATLPDGLSLIGDNAFSETAIGSVNIPSSVTVVGKYLFQNCTALAYAEYLTPVTKYGTGATYYSTYLFDGCTSLERVVLNSSIQYIPGYMFTNCTSLTTIDLYDPSTGMITESDAGVASLPAGLTYMGAHSFENTAIREITIPRGVTSSMTAMFSGCTKLEKVMLHDALTVIEEEMFMNCSSLKTVQYMTAENALCGEENAVTLPGSIKEVADNAFNASGVLKVYFPATVTNAGDYLFANCAQLATVVLDDALTEIAPYMFDNTPALTTVQTYTIAEDGTYAIVGEEGKGVLPSALEELGDGAFGGSCVGEFSLPATLDAIGENALGTGAVTVAEGSSYLVVENVLLDEDGVVLHVPASFTGVDGKYTVPEAVSEIGAYALAGSTLTEITVSTDQITGYSFAGFTGDIVITLGSTKTLPNNVFRGYEGTSVTLPEGITTLGTYTFYECPNIVSISLPASVTKIGNYSFQHCDSLESVNIPTYTNTSAFSSGGAPFRYSPKLTTITLGDGVTRIPNYMFYETTALGSIDLPESLKNLGTYAFTSSGVTSVNIPSGVTSIGSNTFKDCSKLEFVTISGNITSIGTNAFQNCVSLKAIDLPDSLKTINSTAFSGCVLLEDVTLPAGLTSLAASSFASTAVKSVVIPVGVTTLNNSVFAGNTALETVYLPDTLDTIGGSTFSGCTSLKNVYTYSLSDDGEMILKNNAEQADGIADLSCITKIGTSAFDGDGLLTAVIFSNELAEIGNYAFRATGLTSVTIPGSVGDELGDYVFENCLALTAAVLGEGITDIPSGTFRYCAQLSDITLPESLATIRGYAFTGCTSIESLVLSKNVKLFANVFQGWTEDQTITAYADALDGGCEWLYNAFLNCNAVIKIIAVYPEDDSEGEETGDEETSPESPVVDPVA